MRVPPFDYGHHNWCVASCWTFLDVTVGTKIKPSNLAVCSRVVNEDRRRSNATLSDYIILKPSAICGPALSCDF